MAEDDSGKILTHIKAALGLQSDYDPFDTELIMHINSILSILNQLGVGPETPLVINADTEWNELLADSKVEDAKTYIFLRVKLIFDSATMPASVITSYERMISELEFRLTVATDPMIPQDPGELVDDEDEPLILDGDGS